MARIIWTFRIDADPGESFVEVPVWGDTVSFCEVTDLPSLGRTAAKLVAEQFYGSLLKATGVLPPTTELLPSEFSLSKEGDGVIWAATHFKRWPLPFPSPKDGD